MMVKLSNYYTKDKIYKSRTKLKEKTFQNKTIYFNEDLPKLTSELFFKTRKLANEFNLKAVWTYNGQIFVKEKDRSTPLIIRNEEKLQEYERFLKLR